MKRSSPARTMHELRARRHRLLADLALPPDGLPGSLVQTRRRCGSMTCHCHGDVDGHPSWTLTFMANGTKRVVHVPGDTADDVQQRVAAGNAFKSGVAELMAINAQLMVLERQAEKQAATRTRRAR